MKIEIFEEKATEENVLRLKLVRDGDSVKVIAVDALGEPLPEGNLLKIRSGGTLYRFGAIDKSLGLSLDSRGRIIEDVS